jgi:peroxin-10
MASNDKHLPITNNLRTGTRWLTRWEKEVELLVKLGYYGLTTGRSECDATDSPTVLTIVPTTDLQTLGEEYTDIWILPLSTTLWNTSHKLKMLLVLLPALSSYLLSKLSFSYGSSSTWATALRRLPILVEVAGEVNLAVFYLRGTYYDLCKRILGIRSVSIAPFKPHEHPEKTNRRFHPYPRIRTFDLHPTHFWESCWVLD